MNPRRRRHARHRRAARRERARGPNFFTWTRKVSNLRIYDADQVILYFRDVETGVEYEIKGSDAIEDGHFVVEAPPEHVFLVHP